MSNLLDRVTVEGRAPGHSPVAAAAVPALPPTSAAPTVELPRRRGLYLRFLVPFVAALPVGLAADVHAAVLFASALLLAAIVDDRRPPALETLPFARSATTVVAVASATVAGAIAAVALWGTIPVPLVGAAAATAAAAGLLVARRLEERRSVVRVLVLGTSAETQELERTTSEVGSRRFRIAAGTDSLTELEALVATSGADLIVYTDHVARPAVLGHLAAVMRHRRVRAMHLDRFCEQALGVVPLAAADAAWLADLADPSGHGRDNPAGRALDVVVSLVALVLVAPLLLALAPLIAMDREGGPFFRQARMGRDGRPFQILKLRTMRGTGSDWAVPDDPRVTRLGAFLRRTHIDELPQLINVLRGDMALVGPRPEQVGIAAELERDLPLFPYRNLVRPGITGWARVRTGYARTSEESALKLGNDLFYIKHRSLIVDVAVLLETLRVALFEDQFTVRAPAAAYILGADRVTVEDVYAQRIPLDLRTDAEHPPVAAAAPSATAGGSRPFSVLARGTGAPEADTGLIRSRIRVDALATHDRPMATALQQDTTRTVAGAATVDVSVLIPVLNEAAHLERTVRAMRDQDFAGTIEFLFVDGGSNDDSVELLERMSFEDPRIRVLHNPQRIVPTGLNVGLQAARGEYVARMDAHTEYPVSYLRHGVERLAQGDVDWVTGPQVPVGQGYWSKVVSSALGGNLGRGASDKWQAEGDGGPDEWDLTTSVFVGVWRRETLDELGGWDPKWVVNEDSEMAARILDDGGRIVCRTEMGASYVPRDSIGRLARQYFKYGTFRAWTFARHPTSCGPARLAASLLPLMVLFALLPGPLGTAARALSGLYLLAVGAQVLRSRPRLKDAAPLAIVLITMHMSWGAGFLLAAVRMLPQQRLLRATAPVPLLRSHVN